MDGRPVQRHSCTARWGTAGHLTPWAPNLSPNPPTYSPAGGGSATPEGHCVDPVCGATRAGPNWSHSRARRHAHTEAPGGQLIIERRAKFKEQFWRKQGGHDSRGQRGRVRLQPGYNILPVGMRVQREPSRQNHPAQISIWDFIGQKGQETRRLRRESATFPILSHGKAGASSTKTYSSPPVRPRRGEQMPLPQTTHQLAVPLTKGI